MPVIKLLVADDHHLFIDGIIALLKDERSFSIAATAGDGYEVLELISKHDYDICLLDISMPRLDGIATARQIR
jgi:DNA-binding NarL/FixJ family response regulator